MTYALITALVLKLLYALLILLIGNVLAGWLQGVVSTSLARTRIDPLIRRLLVSVVRPVVIALAVFAALQQLGIPITTFAAIVGAVTLAVGLSLQGSLSNVASGALLLTLRPFNIGDVVTASGITGVVQALDLFTTTMHTPDGQTVTLPNDLVWRSPVTNFSNRPNRRISLTFVIPADADLAAAEETILEALGGHEKVLAEPAPALHWPEATDLGIPIIARAHVLTTDFGGTSAAIQRQVVLSLAAKGITLATRAR